MVATQVEDWQQKINLLSFHVCTYTETYNYINNDNPACLIYKLSYQHTPSLFSQRLYDMQHVRYICQKERLCQKIQFQLHVHVKVRVVYYHNFIDLLSTVTCDAITYFACLSHLAWFNHHPWTMSMMPEHLSPQMWADSPHKREGHCSGENGQNNSQHYHNFLYGIYRPQQRLDKACDCGVDRCGSITQILGTYAIIPPQ